MDGIYNPMKKIKIITVLGARPQFIKAASLSPNFCNSDAEEIIVHTGQHFDEEMSNIFFDEMNISTPRYNLCIGGGSHAQNTGRMIEGLENIFIKEKPNVVLIFGDTDSTLAAAITASKLGIFLVHIEAGLRSFRRAMPEEINRVLTDHVADILYTPSQVAAENLYREGISSEKVCTVGDIMSDSVLKFSNECNNNSNILEKLSLTKSKFNLLTLHRKENTSEPVILKRILEGMSDSDLPIIFPVHPRTKGALNLYKIKLPACIQTTGPLGYLDTLKLLKNCNLLLTDSGGMQKEAYYLHKPCVTLRDETEWTELVDQGVNLVVGTSPQKIKMSMAKTDWPPFIDGLYGDGTVGKRIANDLINRISRTL